MNETSCDLKLLVIEDDPAELFFLKEMLRSIPLEIQNFFEAGGMEVACKVLKNNPVHLIFLSLSLPGYSGLQGFLEIQKCINIPVIILTDHSTIDIARQAIKAGAHDYLVKGEFNKSLLNRSIHYSLERNNQDKKLKESEEKYKEMFHKSPFPSMIYEKRSLQFIEVNDAAIRKYGYSHDEFVNLTLRDIRYDEEIPLFLMNNNNTEEHKKLHLHKKKNGEIMLVEVICFPIKYFGKKVMQALIQDVTEKVKLEKELAVLEKLREHEVSGAVLSAQEKERRYIGAELHDNINQILATVRLHLGMALTREKKDELIKKSRSNINLAIEEIRNLSRKLVKPGLAIGNFSEMFVEMIKEISYASLIKFNMKIDIDETSLKEDVKIASYRIFQEQLNNILKYAKASCVDVDLYEKDRHLVLRIKDNGKGFDVTKKPKGIGISNMISRAEGLGGVVNINTAPDKGCELYVTIPIN